MYRSKTYSLTDELIAEIAELAKVHGSLANVIRLGVELLKATTPSPQPAGGNLTDAFPNGIVVEMRGGEVVSAKDEPKGGARSTSKGTPERQFKGSILKPKEKKK